MLPHVHLLSGVVMGLLGYEVGILNSFFEVMIVVFLTVGFDIDHLAHYYMRHRKIDVVDCWNKSVERKEHNRTFIHKSPGFFYISLVSLLLFLISRSMFYILVSSYYTHMFLDKINMKKKQLVEFRSLFKKRFVFFPINYVEEIFSVFFIVCIIVLLA